MRVLICDDEPAHRALVRAILGVEADVEIVGEAADGTTCLDEIRTARPDLVVLDLKMPGCDGFEVMRRLRDDPDAPRVLVHSSASAAEVADRVRQEGGEFLRKGGGPDELTKAIRRVAS
jgi:DNA-binding NarL/FixJ family response regulator